MTTSALGLREEPSGDTNWYASYLEARRVMDSMASPDKMFYVSPKFIDANLGDDILSTTDRRYFSTVQAAIDAAEGAGYNWRNVIKVFPGEYSESLTINGSISIYGELTPFYESFGAGRSIIIRGVSTAQAPVVTVNQPDGVTMAVNFQNIVFENAYNQQAGSIDKPYLMQVNKPATTYGAYAAWVGMKNCQIRAQTWGADNDWSSLIKATGWVRMYLNGLQVVHGTYAGGSNNGGIARMFHIEGDSAALPDPKESSIYVSRCDFKHVYTGGLSPCYFLLFNHVTGSVYDSSFSTADPFDPATPTAIPLSVAGGAGVNGLSGINEGDLNSFPYKNTTGVNQVFF